MATINPYQAYQQNSVTTASPGELTLMLYNGCLKFINQAEISIKEKKYEIKNENLKKAQSIILELMATLKTDFEFTKNMMSLYEYINHLLIEANIKNDLVSLKEAEELVIDFRDTWKQVIKINRKQNYQGGSI